MENQQTIARPIEIEGIGLHTGVKVHVRLLPAAAATGVVFMRTDLAGFLIEAKAANVERVSYATTLMKKGVLISTIEHLMSALAGEGIDNVVVEIDNLELPILDGSARPFVEALGQAGTRPLRARRKFLKVMKPVEISEGSKRIAVYPAEKLCVTCRIAFSHPKIGEQSVEFDPETNDFKNEIAPARTFGFLEEVEMLQKNGLVRGGSLENAVVLTRDGILNPEGVRFPDEFCRHKLLDLIGDLSLLGHPLVGHVVAERAGHAMHVALVRRLLSEKGATKLINASAAKAGEPARAERATETGAVEAMRRDRTGFTLAS